MRSRNEKLSLLFREKNPQKHRKGINKLEVLGSSLFSAGRDGVVREWDLDNLSVKQVLDSHVHWVNDIQIDSERGLLFSASSDTNILIWNLNTRKGIPDCRIEQHKDYLQSIKYVQENHWLYAGGQDGHLVRWDVNQPDNPRFLRIHNTQGTSIWCIDTDRTGEVICATFSNKVKLT